jgi:anti-sigma regulatory factor (Ser/Thr protein kinase)
MAKSELLRLTLPANAENVAVARHAMAGACEALGMDSEAIADVKTIVTEACMNVAVHAYDGDEGPLELVADEEDGCLVIVVRDFGQGIKPRASVDEDSLRLGLSLIAALSSSFELRGGSEVGTEVWMRVDIVRDEAAGEAETVEPPPHDQTRISLEPGELAAPIVGRVISALAIRADLPIDRLSEAVLLGEAISIRPAADFSEGRLQLAIEEVDGRIDLRIGPLEKGAAERILAAMELPGFNGNLSTLADEVSVDSGDVGEVLRLRIERKPVPS